MELKIDVFYSNVKAGTYVQFKLEVNSCELSEIMAYDRLFQKQIRNDFKPLIKRFQLDFTTDNSYIVHEDGKNILMICLQGKTTPEFESALKRAGINRRDF